MKRIFIFFLFLFLTFISPVFIVIPLLFIYTVISDSRMFYEIFAIGLIMDIIHIDKFPIYLIAVTIIFIFSNFLRKRIIIHV